MPAVRFEITHNLDQLIEGLEEDREKLREMVEEGLNEAIDYTEDMAKYLTVNALPSGGGSYLEAFEKTPAHETMPNNWEASLANRHKWAEAVEKGGGPRVPHRKFFAIPPGKSPYMTQRRFASRKVPRGFHIFEYTFMNLRTKLDQFMRRMINF